MVWITSFNFRYLDRYLCLLLVIHLMASQLWSSGIDSVPGTILRNLLQMYFPRSLSSFVSVSSLASVFRSTWHFYIHCLPFGVPAEPSQPLISISVVYCWPLISHTKSKDVTSRLRGGWEEVGSDGKWGSVACSRHLLLPHQTRVIALGTVNGAGVDRNRKCLRGRKHTETSDSWPLFRQ